jgi:hypothetical protein
VLTLTYTIENPTNYFLTFSLLMETNDEFAFSGPKQTALQLLPVSKAAVEYRVFPYVRGAWIRPALKVVDRYFNKTLKTAPGGEDTAVDKAGLMVWVPEEMVVAEEAEVVEEAEEAEEEAEEEEGEESEEEEEEEDSEYVDESEETDSLEYREDSDEEDERSEEEGKGEKGEEGKESKEE